MAAPGLVWHTYPLGLLGADQSGRDRACHQSLADLGRWLPHVRSLGADAVLLGPVFSALSHGYDTVTHRDVDDRLGQITDVEALVAEARSHDLGIILDGAFAYVSRSFWRLDDPAESYEPWLRRTLDGDLVPWRGVESLVTPDFDSLGYQTYVAEVLSAWLDRGITGWRLDSAWTVPAPFWRKVLARVRQAHPDAWFLGQVFDDDLPPVINRATYSSATGYALMHGTREWLSGGAVEGMVSTLRVHQDNGSRQPVHTFLGNHDFARLADTVPADLLAAAFVILLTLPGVPAVYYGDEVAAISTSVEGGTDAVLRPPMSVGDLSHLTGPAADLLQTVRRLGEFRRSHRWLAGASVADVRVRDGGIAYRCRRTDGRDAIDVYVNPSTVATRWDGADGEQVLGSAVSVGPSSIEIPPRGWAVFPSSR